MKLTVQHARDIERKALDQVHVAAKYKGEVDDLVRKVRGADDSTLFDPPLDADTIDEIEDTAKFIATMVEIIKKDADKCSAQISDMMVYLASYEASALLAEEGDMKRFADHLMAKYTSLKDDLSKRMDVLMSVIEVEHQKCRELFASLRR